MASSRLPTNSRLGKRAVARRPAPRSGRGAPTATGAARDPYRALMEDCSDAIFILAPDTTVREANRAAERLPGRPREEIVGVSFLDFLPPEERARVAENFRGARAKANFHESTSVLRRDGEKVLVSISASRVEIGGEVLTYAIVQDIASRASTERALEESERKYRDLVEHAPLGISRSTLQGRFVEANAAFARILGYASVQEVLSLDIPQGIYWAAQDRERVFATMQEEGGCASLEVRFKKKNGLPVWVQLDSRLVRDPAGRVLYCEGFLRDIDDRKRAQENLRRSEEGYRLLFEASPSARWVLDAETRKFIAVNGAAVLLYGYSREEFLRMTVLDIRPPEEIPRLEAILAGWTEKTRYTGLSTHRKKDGTLIEVEITADSIDFEGRPARLVQARDVTGERRSERRLLAFTDLAHRLSSAESAPEAARMIAACADGLWHWDACTVDRYSSELDRVDPLLTVDSIDGRRQDVPPLRAGAAPSPRQRRVLEEGALLLLRDGEPAASDSIPFGDTKHLSASILIAPIHHGRRIIGFVSIQSYSSRAYDSGDLEVLQSLADFCGDAFVSIQATDELRRSERQLREAQQAGHIGSWEWEVDDLSIVCSEQMYEVFGIDRARGRTVDGFLEIIHSEDRSRIWEETQSAVREQRPFEYEYRIERPDGETRLVSARGDVISNALGQPTRVIGICQDVTDRRKAEEELRASRERLLVLSRRLIEVQESERRHIARELHDEVGQALTAVKINLQAASRPDDDADHVARLQDSMEIVETTIRQVRDLSLALRPSLLDDLGLVAALRWYVDSQAQRAGFEARFEAEPEQIRLSSNLEIGCYRVVQEAVTNILRHARARHVLARIRLEEGQLELVIRDDGRGFDVEAARGRAQSGESIGLLGMFERTRLLGGRLKIESVEGKGTQVRAVFPAGPRP